LYEHSCRPLGSSSCSLVGGLHCRRERDRDRDRDEERHRDRDRDRDVSNDRDGYSDRETCACTDIQWVIHTMYTPTERERENKKSIDTGSA